MLKIFLYLLEEFGIDENRLKPVSLFQLKVTGSLTKISIRNNLLSSTLILILFVPYYMILICRMK